MSDADVILSKLKEIRMRQFLALLLRSGIVAFFVFALWLSLCLSGIFPALRLSATAQAAAGVCAGGAALLISLLRFPSMKEAAKIADRALGLQQRLETSWECIPPREGIDTLILRDTSRRVAGVRPSNVVQVHPGRMAGRLILICLLAAVSLSIVGILLKSRRSPISGTATAASNALSQAARAKKAPGASAAKSPERAPGKSATHANQTSNAGSGQGMASPDADKTSKSAAGQGSLQPAPGVPATSAPDRGVDALQERVSTASRSTPGESVAVREKSAPANQEGRPGADPENEIGTRGPDPVAGSASRSDSGARTARKFSSGGGLNASAAAASKAGEGSGVAFSRQAGESRSQIPSGQPSTARMGDYFPDSPEFWVSLEEALRKEKIPPGFRKYIADYFRAIHP